MYMYMYFGSMYFDKIRRGKWRGGGQERGNIFHVYEAEWYFRRADVHSIRVFRKNSFEIRIPLDRGIERAGFGGFPDRSAGGHCLTTSRDPCGSTTARPPCILLSKHGADIFALPVV